MSDSAIERLIPCCPVCGRQLMPPMGSPVVGAVVVDCDARCTGRNLKARFWVQQYASGGFCDIHETDYNVCRAMHA
jgi:hypothetical protein